MTKDEINQKILELTEQRNKLSAITVDGVPIEKGMRLYCADIYGLDTFVVDATVRYDEYNLSMSSQFRNERYQDLFADLETCIKEITKRVREQVIRTERAYLAVQESLEKLEGSIKNDINREFEGKERLEALLTLKRVTS